MKKKTADLRFIKNSSLYLLSSISSAVISFLTLPIYTRFVSPEGYGIFTLFLMFGQISSNFISLGLQSAAYRYYFEYKDKINTYANLNSSILFYLLLSYLTFGIIIYNSANFIAIKVFDNKIDERIIRLSFLSGCLDYLSTYFLFILTAQNKALQFSIVEIFRSVIRAIIALYLMISYNMTYYALISSTIITQLLVIIILIILSLNLLKLHFSYKHFKKSLNFSYPMILRLGIGVINQSFDKMMLTNFSGLGSVGFYSIGEKFASVLKIIMDAIGKVWNPYFFKKVHNKEKSSLKEIGSNFIYISFLVMIMALTLTLFGEEIIILFFNQEYFNVMYIIPIYTFSVLFTVLGMLSVPQIQYSEKTLYMLPSSVFNMTLNIILNFLLIPRYGVFGAIISLMVARLIASLINVYIGAKLTPIPVDWKKFTLLLSILFILSIPGYFLMKIDYNMLVKIIIKLLFVFVYIIIGYKLKCIPNNIILKIKHKVKVTC